MNNLSGVINPDQTVRATEQLVQRVGTEVGRLAQSLDTKFEIWQAIRTSKDPATFTVLFEDAAAILALFVAFMGVYLAHRFKNPYLDGVGFSPDWNHSGRRRRPPGCRKQETPGR